MIPACAGTSLQLAGVRLPRLLRFGSTVLTTGHSGQVRSGQVRSPQVCDWLIGEWFVRGNLEFEGFGL
jgi:hypothetical protein